MKKFIFILFLFCPLVVSGTNYYIKNGGNNNNTGLSDAQAWATTTKVIATSFSAGDSILFKRGGTYAIIHTGTPSYADAIDNEKSLVLSGSGTSGNRIVIGAYGTGARPIINGRFSLPNWNVAGTWTNTSGNIWRMYGSIYAYTSSNQDRGRLWLNGVEAKKAQSITTPTAAEPWTHGNSGNYLYVYSIGNPASYYSNIEDQGWSNDCIVVNGSYQTWQNLDIRGCNHSISLAYDKHYIIFEDCNIGKDIGMQGFFIDGSYVGISNIIIRRCTIDSDNHVMDGWMRQNTEDGIHLRGACTNVEIYDNTIADFEHASICLTANGSDEMNNILIHDNYVSASNIDYSKGFDVSAVTGNMTGLEVYNNIFYDFPNEIQISAENVKFYNNIIDKTTRPAYYEEWIGPMSHGIAVNSNSGVSNPVTGTMIYNNTIVNCYDAGITFQTWGDVQTNGFYIRNNILYNNDTKAGTNSYQIYIPSANMGSGTYQNNALYSPTNTYSVFYERGNPDYATVTEWNSRDSGGDVISNNIVANSAATLFVDFANRDYHLIAGANVIGAGIGVGLILDYDGNAINNPPDIGAYAYNSTPPEDPPGLPVPVTVGISSITSIYASFYGSVTGLSITDRGFCWGSSVNPTIGDNHEHIGTGTGSFKHYLTGLHGGQTLHVRSFATNSDGTTYGADVSFTTSLYSIGRSGTKTIKVNGKFGVLK